MDAEDQRIADSVARNGWHAISVTDRPPSFVYTVGLLTTFNHPELVLFGLETSTAHSILSSLVREIRNGRSFAKAGTYRGVLEGDVPLLVRKVHPSQHEVFLGYAMAHCRMMGKMGSLAAMQVFWPDQQGKFPIDPGCKVAARNVQPQLDRPGD